MAGDKLKYPPVAAAGLLDRRRKPEPPRADAEESPARLDAQIARARQREQGLEAWLHNAVPAWQRLQARMALCRQLGGARAKQVWQDHMGVDPPGWPGAPGAAVQQAARTFQTRAYGAGGGALAGETVRTSRTAAKMAERAFIQRDAETSAALQEATPDSVLARLDRQGGAPLPEALLQKMSRLFGHDFSGVRIHADSAAAEAAKLLQAHAFTVGRHLYFASGKYDPATPMGERLLIHELTHVVQHDRGQARAAADGKSQVSSPGDPAEQEARAMESRAAPGAAVAPAEAPAAAAGAAEARTPATVSAGSVAARREDDEKAKELVANLARAAMNEVDDGHSAAVLLGTMMMARKHAALKPFAEKLLHTHHPTHGTYLNGLVTIAANGDPNARKAVVDAFARDGVPMEQIAALPGKGELALAAMKEIDRDQPSYKVLMQVIAVARNNGRLRQLGNELLSVPHPRFGSYLNGLLITVSRSGSKETADLLVGVLAKDGVVPVSDEKIVRLPNRQKLERAMRLGAPAIPAEACEQIIGALMMLVPAWAASHLVGIGELVDLAGIAFLGKQAYDAVEDTLDFYHIAVEARTETDLDLAGEHFAKAVASVGVAGLLAALGALAKRAAKTKTRTKEPQSGSSTGEAADQKSQAARHDGDAETRHPKQDQAALEPTGVQQSVAERVKELRAKRDAAADLSAAVALDAEIEQTLATGRKDLEEMVRKIHPTLQPVRPAENLYKIVLEGKEYFGTLEVLLDFSPPAKSTLELGGRLFSQGSKSDEATVSVTGGLAGTSSQGRVNKYPGDIDLAESVRIEARSNQAAGEALAQTIQRTIAEATKQTPGRPALVFEKMSAGVFPKDAPKAGKAVSWSSADVAAGHFAYLDAQGNQRFLTLAQALGSPGERVVNTFWKGPIDANGTYGEITKVIRYEAFDAKTGEKLFATPSIGQAYQEVAFGEPQIHDANRPHLTNALAPQIEQYARKGNWVKAIKRAHTVARMNGDMAALNDFAPLMSNANAHVKQVSEHLALFAREIVNPDGTGAGSVTQAQAMEQGHHLAQRVVAVNAEAGAAMARALRDAGNDIVGNGRLYRTIEKDVLTLLEQASENDPDYAKRAERALRAHGYLRPENADSHSDFR